MCSIAFCSIKIPTVVKMIKSISIQPENELCLYCPRAQVPPVARSLPPNDLSAFPSENLHKNDHKKENPCMDSINLNLCQSALLFYQTSLLLPHAPPDPLFLTSPKNHISLTLIVFNNQQKMSWFQWFVALFIHATFNILHKTRPRLPTTYLFVNFTFRVKIKEILMLEGVFKWTSRAYLPGYLSNHSYLWQRAWASLVIETGRVLNGIIC